MFYLENKAWYIIITQKKKVGSGILDSTYLPTRLPACLATISFEYYMEWLHRYKAYKVIACADQLLPDLTGDTKTFTYVKIKPEEKIYEKQNIWRFPALPLVLLTFSNKVLTFAMLNK